GAVPRAVRVEPQPAEGRGAHAVVRRVVRERARRDGLPAGRQALLRAHWKSVDRLDGRDDLHRHADRVGDPVAPAGRAAGSRRGTAANAARGVGVSDDRASAKRIVEDGYDRVALRYAELEGEETWPRMRWVRRVLSEVPD